MSHDKEKEAKAKKPEPENYSGAPGEHGPGSVPGGQAMGKEGGAPEGSCQTGTQFHGMAEEMGAPRTHPAPPHMMGDFGLCGPQATGPYTSRGADEQQKAGYAHGESETAQTSRGQTASAFFHPHGDYAGSPPYGSACAGPDQGVFNSGTSYQPYQTPGGPYTYASGPQGNPPTGHPYPQYGPQSAGPHAPHMGYQQGQPYYQAPGQRPHICDHGPAYSQGHHKPETHQCGEFMGLVNDLANGNADPSRVMSFLGSLDTQFWKGAIVGVSATLLLTNETVKNAIVNTLSGILGAISKETEEEQTE